MEYPDRIPWERVYYSDIEIPCSPKSIKCTMCATAFLDERKYISLHIAHLNEVHNITELTHHSKREYFLKKFIINEENFEAKCRTCKKKNCI